MQCTCELFTLFKIYCGLTREKITHDLQCVIYLINGSYLIDQLTPSLNMDLKLVPRNIVLQFSENCGLTSGRILRVHLYIYIPLFTSVCLCVVCVCMCMYSYT